MKRTPLCILVLALALSACGNDAGGDNSYGGEGNTVSVTGNGSADAQTSAPTAPSQGTPASPSDRPSAASVGMPLGKPLGPLLEEDLHSPDKMGCNCMFDGRDGRYLSVIDGELMVRTPAGRQLCPIAEPQLQSLGKRGGEVSCAGVRMSIRETGARTSDVEGDSSGAPATLSASGDGGNGTLDGTWGCAC